MSFPALLRDNQFLSLIGRIDGAKVLRVPALGEAAVDGVEYETEYMDLRFINEIMAELAQK